MKPGNPPLQSIRVLDQLRERIRYMHYSLSTEQVYVYWVRFFIRWSARSGQMRSRCAYPDGLWWEQVASKPIAE